MKTERSNYLIDKMYSKYLTLSKNEKLIINFSFFIILLIIAIERIFNAGENFGEFIYYVFN